MRNETTCLSVCENALNGQPCLYVSLNNIDTLNLVNSLITTHFKRENEKLSSLSVCLWECWKDPPSIVSQCIYHFQHLKTSLLLRSIVCNFLQQQLILQHNRLVYLSLPAFPTQSNNTVSQICITQNNKYCKLVRLSLPAFPTQSLTCERVCNFLQ